ncbi:hypothetical protein [Thalassomonas sp. M1454]|uniref:hypothetical protein n=1 Tax=Thalassomonas sp. M1454 TaxID=2594477 RepID=UPI00163D6324|nr:hypothetical protein [Thalassomonas sp. M1454]
MNYQRLAELTQKVLAKVNTFEEMQEYQELHNELHNVIRQQRWQPKTETTE